MILERSTKAILNCIAWPLSALQDLDFLPLLTSIDALKLYIMNFRDSTLKPLPPALKRAFDYWARGQIVYFKGWERAILMRQTSPIT